MSIGEQGHKEQIERPTLPNDNFAPLAIKGAIQVYEWQLLLLWVMRERET
jgi:hypothetical protein